MQYKNSSEYKKEQEKFIIRKAEVNGLSKKQTRKLLKDNVDVDLLDREIQKAMLTPDIEEIRKRYLPDMKKTIRNNVTPYQILMATIAGDVIGSRFEFAEHSKPASLFADSCFYTDDTVLSVAIADAILKNPQKPDFRTSLIDAYNKYPDAGYGYNFVLWAKGIDIDNTVGYGSYANGSAMRVSFIPAYYNNIKQVIKYTVDSAMVTHNHLEGVKGAVVLSVCIWMALNGYNKNEIYDYCNKHYYYNEENKKLLINGWNLYDISIGKFTLGNEVSKNSMFCNYAVPFVIKCFCKTHSYEECLYTILDGFGDSDTLCAMASGLCYAYYKAAPFDLKTVMSRYRVDEDLLNGAFQNEDGAFRQGFFTGVDHISKKERLIRYDG